MKHPLKHPRGAMLQISCQSYFLKGKNEAPKHGMTGSTGEQRIEPNQSLLLPLPHTWVSGAAPMGPRVPEPAGTGAAPVQPTVGS